MQSINLRNLIPMLKEQVHDIVILTFSILNHMIHSITLIIVSSLIKYSFYTNMHLVLNVRELNNKCDSIQVNNKQIQFSFKDDMNRLGETVKILLVNSNSRLMTIQENIVRVKNCKKK